MRWVSTISRHEAFDRAMEHVCGEVRARLDGRIPDLLIVFVSHHHQKHWPIVARRLRETFRDAVVVGSTAAGVVGDGEEVEIGPGLALTAACLPGVECTPVRIDTAVARDPELGRLLRQPGLGGPPPAALMLLCDPYGCDPNALLPALDELWPQTPIFGGMSSGQAQPHRNCLYLGDEALEGGAVGLALRGRIEVDTIVCQGCRPIGAPMFVTAHDGIRIFELDGQKPLTVLESLIGSLNPRDRSLAQRALFIGMAPRGDLERYEVGDFLIRNVIGVEPPTGALAVAGQPRDGMVVQFHLRDADTSATEIDALVERRARAGTSRLHAILMFSCLGRGVHLYGREGHDAAAIRTHLGPHPISGFFCNGEIGPIHGETHMHGYTTSIALLGEPPTQ